MARSARRGVGQLEVDEAGPGDLDGGQARIAGQALGDGRGQLARVLAHALGGGEGSVRLEVGEVGAVGGGDAAEFGRQATVGEGGFHRLAQTPFEVAHRWFELSPAASAAPAFTRKRLPSRLKAAICGVTSKPTRTSKLAPEVFSAPRGMVIVWTLSVT